MFAALGLWLAEVVVIGFIDFGLLGSALARATTATLWGLLGFSATSMARAGDRAAHCGPRWLDDLIEPRHTPVPRSATPKPYDWIISLIVGVIAAAVFWQPGG
jgi:hypothetical protein